MRGGERQVIVWINYIKQVEDAFKNLTTKFRDHQITDILKLNMYTSVNLLILHNIYAFHVLLCHNSYRIFTFMLVASCHKMDKFINGPLCRKLVSSSRTDLSEMGYNIKKHFLIYCIISPK